MENRNRPSKAIFWTGTIIRILCILFLLFDAGSKIARAKAALEGSGQLGWPEPAVQGLGILLVVCTILYILPRTAVLGAILLSAYLGGATAIMFRAEVQGHPYFFPVVFGILVWAGLFLRDEKIRALIPFRKA
jgi:hypothetical protein